MLETATITMSLRDYEKLQEEIKFSSYMYDRLASQIKGAVIVTRDAEGYLESISAVDEGLLFGILDYLEEE